MGFLWSQPVQKDVEEVGTIADTRAQCCVEWKIKFFNQSSDVDAYCRSPKFYLSDASWNLVLYPNGETANKTTGWVGLFLVKNASDTKIHKICYTLGLKANDGTIFKSEQSTHNFEKERDGCLKLIAREELSRIKSKISQDDVLIFFCEACLEGAENIKVDVDPQTGLQNDLSTLSQNLKDLFLNGGNTDGTIKVKDQEFSVHSQILVARSSAFVPMFTNAMKEKNTGVVEIEDCTPEAFKVFLMFVYCGQLDELATDIVFDLYRISEKYNIKELKSHCINFMKENVSVDIVCDIISLAISHNDAEVLTYGTDFFVKNVKQILPTPKWTDFTREHCVPSNELMIKAFNFKSSDDK